MLRILLPLPNSEAPSPPTTRRPRRRPFLFSLGPPSQPLHLTSSAELCLPPLRKSHFSYSFPSHNSFLCSPIAPAVLLSRSGFAFFSSSSGYLYHNDTTSGASSQLSRHPTHHSAFLTSPLRSLLDLDLDLVLATTLPQRPPSSFYLPKPYTIAMATEVRQRVKPNAAALPADPDTSTSPAATTKGKSEAPHPSGKEKHGRVIQILRGVSLLLFFFTCATTYVQDQHQHQRMAPDCSLCRDLLADRAESTSHNGSVRLSTSSTGVCSTTSWPSQSSPLAWSSPP